MAEEALPSFDLKQHYAHMWEGFVATYKAAALELDPFIDAANDSRFGITLLFRPSQEVREKVLQFLLELQEPEPDQYYYPEPDMHVTVMSVISCHPHFTLESIWVEEYVHLIRDTLQNTGSFQTHFKGITASPSSVMIQGFPVADQLNFLRNQLRENFRNSYLQQTIDTRYVLRTAHSTVVRFKAPLQEASDFLHKLQKYRDLDFGSTTVYDLELVYNDWYQRQAHVQVLERFILR